MLLFILTTLKFTVVMSYKDILTPKKKKKKKDILSLESRDYLPNGNFIFENESPNGNLINHNRQKDELNTNNKI